jgi:hypothetical protein
MIRKIKSLYKYILYKYNKKFKEEVIVIGDSHARVFENKLFSTISHDIFFNVHAVGGATASGLENPNSKTQAYNLFAKALKGKANNKVIIMLGEVDTGFVIWYRANKYDESVNIMMNNTLEKYQNFIDKINKTFNVIVISTPLPTIQDNCNWGEVANARKEIKASQYDRTQLTLMFNIEMEKYCKQNNIVYVNLDHDCIGSKGIVKKELKNSDQNDHHYNQDKYASLLVKKLVHNL